MFTVNIGQQGRGEKRQLLSDVTRGNQSLSEYTHSSLVRALKSALEGDSCRTSMSCSRMITIIFPWKFFYFASSWKALYKQFLYRGKWNNYKKDTSGQSTILIKFISSWLGNGTEQRNTLSRVIWALACRAHHRTCLALHIEHLHPRCRSRALQITKKPYTSKHLLILWNQATRQKD